MSDLFSIIFGKMIFNLVLSTMITLIAMSLTFLSLFVIILGTWIFNRLSEADSIIGKADPAKEGISVKTKLITDDKGEILSIISAAVDLYLKDTEIGYATGFPGKNIWISSPWKTFGRVEAMNASELDER